MKESVAIAKEVDTKKEFSATKSDNIIHRVPNESEMQLGSLGGVIGNIRHDGGTPSVDSIATELGSMHTAQRAYALLALQRTHGNWYVQRVVTGIQAKPKVGQPGDIYEQEADRVADAVMRMPQPEVLRPPEKEEEEKELIQTKLMDGVQVLRQDEEPEEEEEEEQVQTKQASGQTPQASHGLEAQIRTMRGGGQPLPLSVRSFFEPRFGYDFSQVRIHNNRALESARALNAKAFTTGRDIVFGVGHYQPATHEGKRLLAHELTHVVQQKKASDASITKTVFNLGLKRTYPVTKAENVVQAYRLDAYPSNTSGVLGGLASYAERMEQERRAVAFPIADLADLGLKMTEERERRISAAISDNLVHELHLYGHGVAGQIQIGQVNYRSAALRGFGSTFEDLMRSGAIIYAESCLSAEGQVGWELFKQIGRVLLGNKYGWLQGNTTAMHTVAGPIEARPRLFRYPNDFREDVRTQIARGRVFMPADEQFLRSIDINDSRLPRAIRRGMRYTVNAISSPANLNQSHNYFAKFTIYPMGGGRYVHASGSAPWPYSDTSGPSWTFSMEHNGAYYLVLRIWTHRDQNQRNIRDPSGILESNRLNLRFIRRPLNVGYPRV